MRPQYRDGTAMSEREALMIAQALGFRDEESMNRHGARAAVRRDAHAEWIAAKAIAAREAVGAHR